MSYVQGTSTVQNQGKAKQNFDLTNHVTVFINLFVSDASLVPEKTSQRASHNYASLAFWTPIIISHF